MNKIANSTVRLIPASVRKSVIAPFILISALVSPLLCIADEFQSAQLMLNHRVIEVEVAITPQAQEQGLTDRTFLAPGRGMLFVFPQEEVQYFWMKNTQMDLDLAFFNAQFTLVDMTSLIAMDERIYTSRSAAQFVLELPAGWLERNAVELGQTFEILNADWL